MAQNFLSCDRDQELLLPPSLREWLPDDHLAWFVLEVVDEVDLTGFYGAYRQDGHGRAAHEPAMMVALLVYAYAVGVRSSRAIERRCREDIAVRVITANQAPDHATVARLRVRHETALGELFAGVLELCAQAGLVQLGVVAVDGTKIAACASDRQTRTYQQIAKEILGEAAALDAAADELLGDAPGDELGYNAQAVVCPSQVIVAAELNTETIDTPLLAPMIETACRELAAAGIEHTPEIVVADAGYWKNEGIEALAAQGIRPIVAPDADRRKEPRPGRRGGLYDFMRRVLATDHGGQLYARRQAIVEPVFGQLKHNRAAARFQRRGRSAARSEWRLLATTHNILKLWRHTTAPAAA